MRRCLRSITLVCVLLMVLTFSVAPAVGQRYPPYTPFVAWNPNGQFLAVGHDTTLTILDANTLEVVNSLNNLEMQDVSAAWSPDGNRLAIVNGPDLEVWEQVWSDVDAQRSMVYGYYNDLEPPGSREGNMGSLAAIAWNPDGSELAVCPGGQFILLMHPQVCVFGVSITTGEMLPIWTGLPMIGLHFRQFSIDLGTLSMLSRAAS